MVLKLKRVLTPPPLLPLLTSSRRALFCLGNDPVMLIHSQKCESCNEFDGILQQTCCQEADIKMCSHGLRQLVDDKSVASCQQTCCKLIVKTCYPQACCKLFQQDVISLQMANCKKPDLNRLVAT